MTPTVRDVRTGQEENVLVRRLCLRRAPMTETREEWCRIDLLSQNPHDGYAKRRVLSILCRKDVDDEMRKEKLRPPNREQQASA